MKFQPKSEEEIVRDNLLPAGDYAFEVVRAIDATSKSGNEMIELNLKVFDDEGGYRFVKDYLLESMAFKLIHCAQACGLEQEYNDGELIADQFVGRSGFLKLAVKEDKTGQYQPQNSVKDYIKPGENDGKAAPVAAKKPAPATPADLDDEVPF